MTYQYKESGLDNIHLINGYEHVTNEYGDCVVIHDTEGLHQAIALSLSACTRLSGKEFRFLRQYLDLSQKYLGAMLGVSDQAVAKWEKKNNVPRYATIMVTCCVKEKISGNVSIAKKLDEIASLDREIKALELLIEESEAGWKVNAA